jgi:hypothetical protein
LAKILEQGNGVRVSILNTIGDFAALKPGVSTNFQPQLGGCLVETSQRGEQRQ